VSLHNVQQVIHILCCRVKESWGWLQASGLPVHITCVNSYLTALIKEVSRDTIGFTQDPSAFGTAKTNAVGSHNRLVRCLPEDVVV
jgi:hypothetical protein